MHRSLFAILLVFPAILAGCASLPATEVGRVEERRVEYARIHRGVPVVVFENGLGATMDSWNKVFPEIGKEVTVFAYNRPGYGASDPVSTPRDGAHVVDELRALLRSQGLAPPYVLVGHSLGGLYMQYFARRYPQEVAGLVLVDSTHPTQLEGAGAIERQPLWVRLMLKMFLFGQRKGEFASAARTGQDVLSLPTVSGKPVIVLSAVDKTDSELMRHVNDKRADLARLYPGSRHTWVECGHFIQRECPEVVIEAIRDVLAPHAGGGKSMPDTTDRQAPGAAGPAPDARHGGPQG